MASKIEKEHTNLKLFSLSFSLAAITKELKAYVDQNRETTSEALLQQMINGVLAVCDVLESEMLYLEKQAGISISSTMVH